jgi:Ca2+-binding RTX toxin-like protein
MINLNAKDILKKTRGVGGADHSSRRRMSQSRSRRSSVIEALEPRVLLTVTINNGLLTTNPNYFQVTVGAGGSVFNAVIGQTDFITKYDAFLDPAATDFTFTGATVFDLSQSTTDAVAGPTANTAVATETIPVVAGNIDTFLNGVETITPNDQNILVTVTASIAPNSDILDETYVISPVASTTTAPPASLLGLRLYQYLYSNVSVATATGIVNASDYLTVGGSGAAPVLTTVDPVNGVSATLQDGAAASGASLSGYAGDTFDVLEQDILAGGFAPPATGNLPNADLPAATLPSGAAAFGPGLVTQEIDFTITNSQSCTINTSMTAAGPNLNTPIIEVFGNGLEIPNGDSSPQSTDNTYFGVQTYPVPLQYTIEDLDSVSLSLNGTPTVSLGGANPQDFLVTVPPLTQIGGGYNSTFTITYLPTNNVLSTATVSIANNDPNAAPYTFEIEGGNQNVTAVPPDVYEPDSTPAQASVITTNGTLQDRSIPEGYDVEWAKFSLTQTDNVLIQTNGIIGDTDLNLYASSNTASPIATGQSSGTSLFSTISATLNAGTYYIEVSENGQNNPIPAYTLGVDAAPVGAAAPNFFAFLSGSTLVVDPIDLGSTVDLALNSAMVAATVNGQTLYFVPSNVGAIQVNLLGGANVVTIDAQMPAATVNGGSGNDYIAASNSVGDVFYGNAGNDTLIGSTGNDSLYGGKGNNLLIGNAGDDSLTAGTGNSTISGNQGNDTLIAGRGADSLMGGQGNDVIEGGTGNDTMNGGAGNDTITAGAGNNSISGGAGDDTIYAQNGYVDNINGGAGINSASYDNGPTIFDVVTNIENILS